jgi:hypothetical protein
LGVQDRRASRDTSIEIIDTLNDKINATFADPAAKEHGRTATDDADRESGKFIEAETEKWAKVI